MFKRGKKNDDKRTLQPGDTIRHYRIREKLGEGGMGVVYAARDERLDRDVAIKTIREASDDDTLRDRLWREARSAASVNHPNVCHIYEIDEHEGTLYVAMELLKGTSLAERLIAGELPLGEAREIVLGILSALGMLHRRGFIHRDLKPSNVFLTAHGVKLLDFGLARPLATDDDETAHALTMPGVVIGTPRYMAPEQWSRDPVGPRADLFAVGALLFEMLSGRQAFSGSSIAEIYHSVMQDQPPALTGGPDVLAVDRVIQRALSKEARDRYEDAESMAADLRAATHTGETSQPVEVRTTTRLCVWPFQLLREDEEIEFLTRSLPDAIVASLSGVSSLVVRSSAIASQFGDGPPDLQKVAAEAGVDAVLHGTLLRAGNKVRVTTQLIEAPSGTVLASRTTEGSIDNVFRLQDDLVHEIVQSLSMSDTGIEAQVSNRDRPASPKAYEFYLRANQLSYDRRLFPKARDLYLACLEEDPKFAPAWARLGRIYRVMAKYDTGGHHEENYKLAEEAFQKALEINPDNSTAHNLYTYLEVESMGRARDAMVRLVERARSRTTDPQLFAGLVHACRFCGLLEASVAADQRARRLDPGIRTSVQYTYWMKGEYENAIRYDDEDIRFVRSYSLSAIGRLEEATQLWMDLVRGSSGAMPEFGLCVLATLKGDVEEARRAARDITKGGFHDPEGLYFIARNLAHAKIKEDALEMLDQRVIQAGFCCHATLLRDTWFDSIRSEPRFAELLKVSEEGRSEAARAFRKSGGPQLLGVDPS